MILVTGGTGFLGHNLIPYLHAQGYQVRVLVRPQSETRFLREHGVDLAVAEDINDAPAIYRAMEGCWAVIHAAGHFRFWGNTADFWQTNVGGTATVLHAAAHFPIQRFIHISTIAVAGHPAGERIIDETYPPQPVGPYQRTKLEGERLALAYHRERDLPVIVLRPGAFYGPWGHYAFNRLFFEEPLRGWRAKIDGGKHITFPAFVPDVAQGIVLALNKGQAGEIYNICGQSLDHNSLNAIVSDLAGISHFRLSTPRQLMVPLARVWTALSRYTGREPIYPMGLEPYIFGDWLVSADKAERELGFQATPFAIGAKATLEWYWQTGLFRRKGT
ncbi:MAG: NAD-dependent epimerase/dehydratase family protein [Anaerolineae bacterium]|nr:NAD-dependent epimerase/dehydratase family protein [Anaerolineae bacterium]